MDIIALPELIAFAVTLALSIYLFLRRPENVSREIFSISLFLISMSNLLTFYSYYSEGILRLMFLRGSFALFLFSLFVILHFTFALADRRFKIEYYFFPGLIFIATLLTDWFITPQNALALLTTPSGSAILIAELYSLFLSVLGIYMLATLYSKIHAGRLRKKLLWVALGLVVLLGSVLFNIFTRVFVIPFNIPIAYTVVLMAILVVYPFVEAMKNG